MAQQDLVLTTRRTQKRGPPRETGRPRNCRPPVHDQAGSHLAAERVHREHHDQSLEDRLRGLTSMPSQDVPRGLGTCQGENAGRQSEQVAGLAQD